MGKNFKIQNKGDLTVVEVFGDIGESWVEEGVTLKSISDQLKGVGKIRVDISSFGGDAAEAFGIYSILKNHKYKVDTRIIAPTASSGTIIFMAGSKREIQEPSLFLAHNVLSMAFGNVYDLEKLMDDMKAWDEQLVNLYMKDISMNREELVALMREDKWISPEDALNYGFATHLVENKTKVTNSLSKDRQNEIINKLKNYKIMNKKYTNLNKVLDVEGFESQDGGVYLTVENLESIDNKLSDSANKLQTVEGELAASVVAEQETAGEHSEKVEELTGKVTALEQDVEGFNALKIKKDKLESDYNALKAKGTQRNTGEPSLGGEGRKGEGEGARLLKEAKNKGGHI